MISTKLGIEVVLKPPSHWPRFHYALHDLQDLNDRSRIVVISLKRGQCDGNHDCTTTNHLSIVNSSTILLRPSRVQYASSTTFQRPCYDYTTTTHDIPTIPLRSMRLFYVLPTVLLRTVRWYHAYTALTATVLRSLAIACHVCHFFKDFTCVYFSFVLHEDSWI